MNFLPQKDYFEKAVTLLPSHSDAFAHLGIWQTFSLCMDIAAEHTALLKVGIWDLLPKGYFWVTAKSRVKFVMRPALMENLILSTWQQKPSGLRAVRSYELRQENNPVALGKTEWAVIRMEDGKLVPPLSLYAEDTLFPERQALEEPFYRFGENFSPPEEDPASILTSFRVQSADIDFGHHMNNAAYLRALTSCFSVAKWKEMNINDVEIHFKAPCFEGEELLVQRAHMPFIEAQENTPPEQEALCESEFSKMNIVLRFLKKSSNQTAALIRLRA